MRDIGINGIKLPTEDCNDPECPFHGKLSVRGQILKGIVISDKMTKNIVMKRYREKWSYKYQRKQRVSSKIHAYSPPCMEAKIGDIITIAECRPLNKGSSFVVIENKSNINFVDNLLNVDDKWREELYVKDLKEMISLIQKEIKSLPSKSSELPIRLDQLANCQRNLYFISGDIKQLEDSVDNFSKSVSLTPINSSDKLIRLISLGKTQSFLYKTTNDVSSLDSAINAYGEAIETYNVLSTITNNYLPYFLTASKNLADLLIFEYEKNKNASDLKRAVYYYNEFLNSAPTGTSNTPIVLKRLSSAMKYYYTLNQDIDYLEKEINYIQKAVNITNSSSANLPGLLIDLGDSLNEYYECGKSKIPFDKLEKILIESRNSYMKAKGLISDDSINLLKIFNNIGNVSRELYIHTNEISYLKEAIDFWRKSIKSEDLNKQNYSSNNILRLNNLAVGLIDLYEVESDPKYLDESQKIWNRLKRELWTRKNYKS